MNYSMTELTDILKDCDYPSALIPKVAKDLESLSEEACAVFEAWEHSRFLDDKAFDIAGITPAVMRAKNEKMADIAIILVYDHLVKCVHREFGFLFDGKQRDARKTDLERKMSEAMFAAKAKSRTASARPQ